MGTNAIHAPHPRPYPEVVEWSGFMLRAIDGDTIAVSLDVGFRIKPEIDVRLKGVDTPEIVGANREAGYAARDFVNAIVPHETPVVVRTEKLRRSFNRYIAEVEYWTGSEWRDLVAEIIASGHGVASTGGPR